MSLDKHHDHEHDPEYEHDDDDRRDDSDGECHGHTDDAPHGVCERCHRNPASVQVTIMSEQGKMAERWLCMQCAGDLPHLSPGEISPEALQDLIAQLMDTKAIEEIAEKVFNRRNAEKTEDESEDEERPKLFCGNCGYAFLRCKQTGMVGCEHCYTAFAEEMKDDLPVDGGMEPRHRGHTPEQGAAVSLRAVATARLRDLNKQLRRAVANEDYLLAARLRDEIKTIQL